MKHLKSSIRNLENFFNKCYNFQAATPGAPKPHIDDSKAHQVAIGEEFQLNCSASFALGINGYLNWVVPNKKDIDVSLPLETFSLKQLIILIQFQT